MRTPVVFAIAIILVAPLLFSSFACNSSRSSDGPPVGAGHELHESTIPFTIVPPLGQQSIYEITEKWESETTSRDSSHGKERLAITARLETNVTHRKPDGTWTLSVKSTTLDFKMEDNSDEEGQLGDFEKSFSITMDNRGRFLNIPENEEFSSVPRDIVLYGNPIWLLPSMMLTVEPVSVGASWPIDLSLPIDGPDFKVTLTVKGTGTLRRLEGDQTYVDLDFKFELKMPGTDSGPQMYTGKGTSSVAYDLKSARFTSNKLDMTWETVGFAVSDNENDIKTTFADSLQVNLIKK